MWQEIVIGSFITYAVTLILTDDKGIMNKPIRWLRTKPRFIEYTTFGQKWLPVCRFCVAFWVSLVVMSIIGLPEMFLVVYGIAYFLSTQERR